MFASVKLKFIPEEKVSSLFLYKPKPAGLKCEDMTSPPTAPIAPEREI